MARKSRSRRSRRRRRSRRQRGGNDCYKDDKKWVKEQLDDNREAIDIWGEVNYEGRWDVGDKCNSFEDFKTFTEKLKKKDDSESKKDDSESNEVTNEKYQENLAKQKPAVAAEAEAGTVEGTQDDKPAEAPQPRPQLP